MRYTGVCSVWNQRLAKPAWCLSNASQKWCLCTRLCSCLARPCFSNEQEAREVKFHKKHIYSWPDSTRFKTKFLRCKDLLFTERETMGNVCRQGQGYTHWLYCAVKLKVTKIFCQLFTSLFGIRGSAKPKGSAITTENNAQFGLILGRAAAEQSNTRESRCRHGRRRHRHDPTPPHIPTEHNSPVNSNAAHC